MNHKEAIEEFNGGNKGKKVQAALKERYTDYHVFAPPGDKIDAEDAEEAFSLLKAQGVRKGASRRLSAYLTATMLFTAPERKIRVERDVTTPGTALHKGRSDDAWEIDWSRVPINIVDGRIESRRLLPLLRMDAEAGWPDSDRRQRWAEELDQTKPLSGIWARYEEDLKKLTPVQHAALEERLYLPDPNEEVVELHGKRPLPGVPGTTGHIKPDNLPYQERPAPEPRDLGGVRVLVMYVQEDRAFARELMKTLTGPWRNGDIELMDWLNVPAGKNTSQVQAGMLARAQVVLVLVTADALSAPELLPALENHTTPLRIVPILCRPSLWKMSSIGKNTALPRNESVINSPGNHSAWYVVCQELLRVVRTIKLEQG